MKITYLTMMIANYCSFSMLATVRVKCVISIYFKQ